MRRLVSVFLIILFVHSCPGNSPPKSRASTREPPPTRERRPPNKYRAPHSNSPVDSPPPSPSKIPPAPSSPIPLVIWPGMGDSCHNDFSVGSLTTYFQSRIPGLHVHCVSIGGASWLRSTFASFVSNVDDKIEEACRSLEADELLKEGYNAIGFSQGAQFLRGVAQRCPTPPMRTLVSVGGQHQGIYGLPFCGTLEKYATVAYVACDYLRYFISHLAYLPFLSSYIVQLQYWHDPRREDRYKNSNSFLVDLNQERKFNPVYKKNLMKLKNLVLIKFKEDHMVMPIDSQWFGFYRTGQNDEIEPIQESRLYREDLLGLSQMEAEGRLHFLLVPGAHLQLREKDMERIVDEFLR